MKNIIENEMGKLHDALPKDVQHNIATMTDEEWTEYRKSQIKKRQTPTNEVWEYKEITQEGEIK